MSAPSNHKISFVIPATDKRVFDSIESLLRLNLDPVYSFEIIVVFNNCPQPIFNQAKEIFKTKRNNIIIKFIHTPISTIGGARNLGIKNSSGQYIIHMDSDCYVNVDYLEQLEKVAGKEFKIGRGEVVFLDSGGFWDKVNCKLKNLAYHTRNDVSYTPNLIVSTEFHKSGFNFDEKVFHGEDTELGIRLTSAKIFPITLPQLKMFHKDKETFFSLTKKYFQYGVARVYRFKKWQFNGPLWVFYKRLFGEIPPLDSFSFKDRLGILILYLMRDLGVLYGLFSKKFV